jgi:thymidylate kinase
MIIAFLGADGSGKSTVINRFLDYVSDDWAEVKYVHFRPTYFVKGSMSQEAVTNPHEGESMGPVMSLLKLLLFVLEYNWAFYIHYRKPDQLIIFDRYYHDVLADPARIKVSSPFWLVKSIEKLIPKPDVVLYLSASVETLYSRKQEVEREALEQIAKRYLDLAKYYSFHTVSSETSLDITMDNVFSIYDVHRNYLKGKM